MSGQAVIAIGTKQWSVSLATTPEELARGLGGLYAIPAGTGMLFDTGGENILSVTTAPMLFSIDIAFLNTSLVVNGLALGVAAGHLVTTEAPARYFLEVNAGEAQGVQKGQQAALQVLPSQATSWMNQLVSAVASVLALGLAVKVVGAIARQVLPKSKPKAKLFGPRGERLLQTLPHPNPSTRTAAFRLPGRALEIRNITSKEVVDIAIAGFPGEWDRNNLYIRTDDPEGAKRAIAQLGILPGRVREIPISLLPQPKLISLEEGRKAPSELELFPDSPEQCCSSVDGTGLRPQLDRAFREAIARARRKGG